MQFIGRVVRDKTGRRHFSGCFTLALTPLSVARPVTSLRRVGVPPICMGVQITWHDDCYARPMDIATLQKILTETLPAARVEESGSRLRVVERRSKIRLWELILSLVLTARTSAGGRQADALRHYRKLTGQDELFRGAFYARFTCELEALMKVLLDDALAVAIKEPILLPPPIATVSDWLITDSSTVKLSDDLIFDYLGTGDYAALKVHKTYSIGRHNLMDYLVSDARDHDASHFRITEEMRGVGVLVDLGYVSHTFLKDCRKHGVSYVIRLKDGWKVKVDEVITGRTAAEAFDKGPFDFAAALENQSLRFKEGMLDLGISLYVEGQRFPLRLVALEIPGKNTCVFLTNLPQAQYTASLVGSLYRLRWEIEKDNKLNKSDRDMDELDGRKKESVHIMLYAALLGSILVNRVVHHDHRELFATWNDRPRAPFHARLVAMALAAAHSALAEAMATDDLTHPAWRQARAVLEGDGRDPNWRRRPSVLDTLFGFTAPPGRPRRAKMGVRQFAPR